MGAQICGESGRVLKSKGKLIARIFGLDAAGPLYCQPTLHPIDRRLDASDAVYVQGIHTADTMLNGCTTRYGTQDFYPNKGVPPQPGCYSLELSYNNSVICSHFKAIEYYRRTLNRNILYEGCEVERWFVWDSCGGSNYIPRLGLFNQARRNGEFYFTIDD